LGLAKWNVVNLWFGATVKLGGVNQK
jgi:hypothetical protein